MHILIVNNAEPDIADFTAPITRLLEENGCAYEQIEYQQQQMLDVDFNRFDGIILSASPMDVPFKITI